MNDNRLLELVLKKHDIDAMRKKLEAEAEPIGKAIVAELVRREASSVGADRLDGFTVTRTSRRLGYILDDLAANVGATQLRRLTMRAVDAGAVAREIKDGRLDAQLAAKAERRSSEYVTITPPAQARAA